MAQAFMRPRFFIIGERKCATSSLYRYLVAHPNVLPCQLKEPQFFAKSPAEIHAGIEQYWAMFPGKEGTDSISFEWPELNQEGILYHETVQTQRIVGRKYMTGEASANTFHEGHPALVRQYLPEIKLILLLRDPAARAFSHHRMFQRFKEEGRDFARGTRSFAEDMAAGMATVAAGGQDEFVAPGCYLHNLRRWEAHFPREQIRIYWTETLESAPECILQDLLKWLELPPHDYGALLQKRFNQAPPATANAETLTKLKTFYQPYNEALATHLNRQLPWA
ncbi:MAG: sulfotransferase [Bacteroidota bacterium]